MDPAHGGGVARRRPTNGRHRCARAVFIESPTVATAMTDASDVMRPVGCVAMERTRISADRPWEKIVGYSRAVRVGNVVEVSGTAPAGPDGEILLPGDVEGQAREALRIIGEALREAGASLADVVRTRVFLADVSRWEEAGRAHGDVFREIRPANTIVGVSGFVDPAILVEIEVTAVVSE
jgi:enamine deaminase RidA (YjgF/YER057c/UK114 family)